MAQNKNLPGISTLFYTAAIVGGWKPKMMAQLLSESFAALSKAPGSAPFVENQTYLQFSGAYGTRKHRDDAALQRR